MCALFRLPPEVLSRLLHCLTFAEIMVIVQISTLGVSLKRVSSVWLPLCASLRRRKGAARPPSKRLCQSAYTVFVREARDRRHRFERVLLRLTALLRRPPKTVVSQMRDLLKMHSDFPIDWTDVAFGSNSALNACCAYFPFGDERAPLRAVRELLRRGADPNRADMFGLSPLMHAAAHGIPALVRLLLDAGACPHMRGALTSDSIVSYTRVSGGVHRPRTALSAWQWAAHYGRCHGSDICLHSVIQADAGDAQDSTDSLTQPTPSRSSVMSEGGVPPRSGHRACVKLLVHARCKQWPSTTAQETTDYICSHVKQQRQQFPHSWMQEQIGLPQEGLGNGIDSAQGARAHRDVHRKTATPEKCSKPIPFLVHNCSEHLMTAEVNLEGSNPMTQ